MVGGAYSTMYNDLTHTLALMKEIKTDLTRLVNDLMEERRRAERYRVVLEHIDQRAHAIGVLSNPEAALLDIRTLAGAALAAPQAEDPGDTHPLNRLSAAALARAISAVGIPDDETVIERVIANHLAEQAPAQDAGPSDREMLDWLEENGPTVDVIYDHATLVRKWHVVQYHTDTSRRILANADSLREAIRAAMRGEGGAR